MQQSWKKEHFLSADRFFSSSGKIFLKFYKSSSDEPQLLHSNSCWLLCRHFIIIGCIQAHIWFLEKLHFNQEFMNRKVSKRTTKKPEHFCHEIKSEFYRLYLPWNLKASPAVPTEPECIANCSQLVLHHGAFTEPQKAENQIPFLCCQINTIVVISF